MLALKDGQLHPRQGKRFAEKLSECLSRDRSRPARENNDMDTELFKEWFQAFAQAAGITLHVENMYGENNHHIVESCFKALARALRQAIEIDPRKADEVPSTKGVLGS